MNPPPTTSPTPTPHKHGYAPNPTQPNPTQQEGLPNVADVVQALVKGVDIDGNSTIDYHVRPLSALCCAAVYRSPPPRSALL
jgi:hypothetical protein